MLEQIFKLREYGTSLKTEFIAALTTFATMAYVLAVHPEVMSATGMDRSALLTATALGAAFFTLVMGLMTNYPIAQAPGMGGNAIFAYSIVIGMGVPWEAALGLTFYNGVLFLILSATGVRQVFLHAFPETIKAALTVGIGLFIMLIGLKSGGVLQAAPVPTLISLGDLSEPGVLLCLGALVVMITLQRLRVPGAIILTILLATLVGIFLPASDGASTITQLPGRLIDRPASMGSLWLALDFFYLWNHFGSLFPVVLTLLFLDLFSTLVAIQAMCTRAGLVDKTGNILKPKRALSADALATIGGGLMGTATMNCYIESAAGIEAGGRTGLVSVFVALFFLLALLFSPIILIIPSQASAPALILIGILMFQQVSKLDFSDLLVAGPAVLMIVLMPLTNIIDGLFIGMIAYAVIAPLCGRWRDVSALSYILALAFAAYYAAGLRM